MKSGFHFSVRNCGKQRNLEQSLIQSNRDLLQETARSPGWSTALPTASVVLNHAESSLLLASLTGNRLGLGYATSMAADPCSAHNQIPQSRFPSVFTMAMNLLFDRTAQPKTSAWFAAIALFFVLLALYSSALTSTYLFGDESGLFSSIRIREGVFDGIARNGIAHGRPIAGAAYELISDVGRLGEFGLSLLRWGQFAASVAGAVLSLLLLRRLGLATATATLLLIFIWSQPALAIFHAYFMLLPYWIGLYAAILSAWMFVERQGAPFTVGEAVLHGGLFLVGFLTFQMTPFFVLGFVAFHCLTAPDRRARQVSLLSVLVAVTAIYTIGFKIGETQFGLGTYKGAQKLLESNPASILAHANFLSVFEFWNYPFPVARIEHRPALLLLAAAVWLSVVLAGAVVEIRRDRRRLAAWLLAAACVALAFLPVVADGTPRQHMLPPVLCAIVLVGFYAGRVVMAERPRPRLAAAAVIVVAVVAAGAGLQFQRALIGRYAEIFSFAQVSAAARPGTAATPVAVVLPRERVGCTREPCSGYFGRVFPGRGPLMLDGFYEAALAFAGLDRSLPPLYVERIEEAPEGAAIIDWAAYGALLKARHKPVPIVGAPPPGNSGTP
jgi:hypothetical protein